MSKSYGDHMAAAIYAIQKSHEVSRADEEYLQREAMVYAILALAEAISEKKDLTVTLDGRTSVRLDG